MTEGERINGVQRLITVADLAQILQRDKRWVRKTIVNGGLLKPCIGGNCARFAPLVVQEWINKGCPGLRHLRTSGPRVAVR